MNRDVSVTNLVCEYQHNPLGIDAPRPRFSWQLVTGRPGTMQSAWQIQVHEEGVLLWDSGRVKSGQSTHVSYGGPPLRSRQRCNWRVRVWTGSVAVSAWSRAASWETGLMQTADWQADWIDPEGDIDPQAFKPAPFLRRDFDLDANVRSARLYATAHGLYELWLNGQRVGDRWMTPGWSAYHTRLEYQTYDVTDLLRPGANALGAILGDGWWRGKLSLDSKRNSYGERLALLLQLEITLADGSQVVVTSDDEWRATSDGPVRKSDWKDGEIYDARREMPGWNEPGFNARGWHAARVVDHAKDLLAASSSPPVRRAERFTPVVLKSPGGQTILDFGQNISGHVQFRVQGPAGTQVKLSHVEALGKTGEVEPAQTFLNADRLLQEVHYTLRGEGEEIYAPRFTSQGFRYARLEGWPGEPRPEDFEAVAIYSDMPTTGHFACSNEALNQLHSNVLWSMKGNFMDVPTDCPTRERAGWTGDAQVFARAGATLMDCATFFSRWLRDLTAEQKADGLVPNLVPNPYHDGKGMFLVRSTEGSAGWADAAIMVPWALYQSFGDREVLERQYDSMLAWYDFMRRRARKTHWLRRLSPHSLLSPGRRRRLQVLQDRGYHWGEWLEPDDAFPWIFFGLINRLLFSAPYVASAYHKHCADLMAQSAEVLGKADEARQFRDEASAIRAAWSEEFIAADGRLKPDKQASYVRALAFDLAPAELRPKLLQQLLRKLQEDDYHVGTGFLSTGMLCEVLAAEGHADLAWKLLLQESIPSWLYAINKGATTIWETWEAVREDGSGFGSHNHYSKGVVVEFLYRRVAGIEIAAPGYRRIRIQPSPGGGLTWARASIQTLYGEVSSSWRIEGGDFRLEARIPPNTTAEVCLPDGSEPFSVASGLHSWHCRLG
ncbi:MAG: glycoside hydrolase family 78 protein [Anaerolineaceae bacterium]|nr:glycoside hydrolase family 78 protein [Anaerolineaceae bacterium]